MNIIFSRRPARGAFAQRRQDLVATLWGATLLMAVFSCAAPSFAQQSNDGEILDEKAAMNLIEAAQAARDKGDYATCFRKATAAWRLAPTGLVGATLGDCALDEGRYVLAATRLHDVVQNPSETLQKQPELYAYIRGRFEKAKARVGMLSLTVEPLDGVVVRLDDGEIDAAVVRGERPLFVAPGTYTLEALRAGDQRTEMVVLRANQEEKVTLSFLDASDGNAGAGGGGGAGSNPGSGTDTSSGLPAWPFVAAIGGAATLGLLVGGGVLRAQANSAADEADTVRTSLGPQAPGVCAGAAESECQRLSELVADKEQNVNTSTGLFVAGAGVGVATIVTTIILVASEDSDDETTTVGKSAPSWRFNPRWSPHEVGATATWRW